MRGEGDNEEWILKLFFFFFFKKGNILFQIICLCAASVPKHDVLYHDLHLFNNAFI